MDSFLSLMSYMDILNSVLGTKATTLPIRALSCVLMTPAHSLKGIHSQFEL